MHEKLPVVYVTRHGETAWSLTGQHTGRADLPLTARGEEEARRLGARLKQFSVVRIYTSPLQRATRTCALAGFQAEVDPNLVEWDYGSYEGRRLAEIRAERPDWDLFRDGCPNGETPAQVGARADAVVRRLREIDGDVLLFSSGHLLRVLAARWLGLEPGAARHFLLNTASLSILGYEHDRARSVLRLWNDTQHLQ